MRALQHCDFCDSEAAGTFEVLPPELEPTDTEQRRVVLCPACKEQLGTLLEPLLARLRGEPAVEADGVTNRSGAHAGERSEEGSEDGGESESENQSDAPSTTRGNEITFGDAEAVETATTSGIEAGEDTESEPAATLEADRDPESKSESELESEPATGTDTEPAGESKPAGELEPVPETEPATDTDAKSDTSATTGEAKTDSASTATKTDEPSKPSVPQAYPKVIRLLRNRELPMDRNAVESLAAGAYDLEARQAEAIVDHALEKEEFTEQGGQLHRA